jgi:two-component system chemotaxis sensor kinase CheA
MKTGLGFWNSLGKYREIVLAVAFFLVFDMAVLVLNFYISYQLSSDAVSINLSGRQRMLSQRMTKVLYGLQLSDISGKPIQNDLAELKLASELFGSTLQGFVDGAEVTGGAGNKQFLKRAETDSEQLILTEALRIWQGFQLRITPLLDGHYDKAHLADTVAYASANNLRLLELMNNLTSELEADAQGKADRLRMIQTAGIVLALLNFLFILFKFIRRLRESDEATEAARKETDDILATVREGLFLLDADFRIGSQFSRSLGTLLDWKVAPGDNFIDYLRRNLSAKDFEDARDFIELLFSDRVLENLMGDLNPLDQLAINPPGSKETRYLSFQFNQVRGGGKTHHLLVTAQDVTKQTILAMTLDEVRKESRGEISVLLELLDSSPVLLKSFLQNARQSLDYINQSFENQGKGEHRRLVDTIFRHVHTLKGEAATINLEMFVQAFQDFESALRTLRESSSLDGEDLLTLMPYLETCFAKVQQVSHIVERLHRFQSLADHSEMPQADSHPVTTTPGPLTEIRAFVDQTTLLAERIAEPLGKQVHLEADLAALSRCNEQQRHYIFDIITQCVRNAIVHGIETPTVRHAVGKAERGLLNIRLVMDAAGNAELECCDDGQGINVDAIRETLMRSGVCCAEELQDYSQQQIVETIFESGISTATEVNQDAGQGVGLAIVKERTQNIGGVLRLKSRPRQFTAFSIRFKV